MRPENKQKSINNNLLRKKLSLNETDSKVCCSKECLRACRGKEVSADRWDSEKETSFIKSDQGE